MSCKYERLLRRLRQDPRLWEDGPKGSQISRLIDLVKCRMAPTWRERHDKNQEARLERWFSIQ